MMGKMGMKGILDWALGIAIIILRTPFVNFDLSVNDLTQMVADKVKDGKVSDEDLADIIEYLKDKIK